MRFRPRILAAALLCAALTLAGCGGDDAAPAGADATSAPLGTAIPGLGASEAPAPPPPAGSGSAAGSGSGSGPGSGGAATSKAAPAKAATKASLKRAAQQYATGLLRGDFAKLAPYLDTSCTLEDRAGLIVALGSVKRLAEGATMTITGTRVVGKRGNVTAYRLSAKAPAELRQVLDESFRQATSNPWRFAGGRWRNTGPCSGDAAVPGAGTGPVRRT